jgi:hypothetical protein
MELLCQQSPRLLCAPTAIHPADKFKVALAQVPDIDAAAFDQRLPVTK